MNEKQDRQGVRRASDLEQKYRFGSVFKNQDAKNKEHAEQLDAQNMSMEQFRQYAIRQFDKVEESLQALSGDLGRYWETVYPVGAVYVSLSEDDPTKLFGGTWERIKDAFLLSAGDNYAAGETGGEAEHMLTLEEAPAHTHERGTMDITGSFETRPNVTSDDGGPVVKASGAFTFTASKGSQKDYGMAEDSTAYTNDLVDFAASRSWTGETSESGGGTAHNNMPPYLAVYMWKRTA